jgi:hypothetical protein
MSCKSQRSKARKATEKRMEGNMSNTAYQLLHFNTSSFALDHSFVQMFTECLPRDRRKPKGKGEDNDNYYFLQH